MIWLPFHFCFRNRRNGINSVCAVFLFFLRSFCLVFFYSARPSCKFFRVLEKFYRLKFMSDAYLIAYIVRNWITYIIMWKRFSISIFASEPWILLKECRLFYQVYLWILNVLLSLSVCAWTEFWMLERIRNERKVLHIVLLQIYKTQFPFVPKSLDLIYDLYCNFDIEFYQHELVIHGLANGKGIIDFGWCFYTWTIISSIVCIKIASQTNALCVFFVSIAVSLAWIM